MQGSLARFGVLCSLLVLAACGDDGSSGEAPTPVPIDHETIDESLGANLEAVVPAGDALAEMLEGSKLYNDTIKEFLKSCEDEEVCEFNEEAGFDECESVEVCEEFELPSIDVEEFVAELRESVFAEKNIETVEDTRVTYRLDPTLFCDEEGGEESEPCEPLEAPIRVSVTSLGQGDLDVEVLFGEERVNPVDIHIHRDLLGATVDMAAVKSVLESLFEEESEVPEVMEGIVELGLHRRSEQAFEGVVSLPEGVAFALGIEGETLEVNVEAAAPLASAAFDFAAETMEAQVDMSAIDVKLPMAALFDDEECEFDAERGEEVCTPVELPAGPMLVHVDGVTGRLLFDATSEQVTLTGAGLGDDTTTVHIGDDQIIAVDVNAGQGRTFDAAVAVTDEAISVSFAPSLKIDVAFDMGSAGLDVPEFLLDEDLSVSLEGSNPTVSFGDERIQVSGGTLLFSSTSHGDVLIEDGMCIGSVEEEEGDDHPFSSLVAESCQP